jgi:acetyltransferase
MAPRSVAVIGASTNPHKSGGILFKNIVDGAYLGRLYPINQRADVVLGHPAFPSITAVPEAVDLAFIVVPKAGVKDALEDCARSGVKSACIITAGFGESGEVGREAQLELASIARDRQILTIGPNTIGLINAEQSLMGSFAPFPRWQSGTISIFAQTGIFAGAAALQVMSQDAQRLGIGKSIDVGNKVDVDEIDFLHFASGDPTTEVIGLYLEEMRNQRTFLELANRVKQTKPIVLLKPGRTEQGAVASQSHTGSMASNEQVLDPALRQFGIIRADDIDDFFAYLKAFSYLPLPRGERLGIVTYSGALGVIAVDETVREGLTLADFSEATLRRVGDVLPAWQPASNPADAWVAVEMGGYRSGHEVPFQAVLDDPGTDMVLGILFAPPNADFPDFRDVFSQLRQRQPTKPLALVIYGGEVRERWLPELDGAGIPVFSSTRLAIRALRAMARYSARRGVVYEPMAVTV